MSEGDVAALRQAGLPWLSVDQMREVDRLMVDEVGIALEQMMENAGRNLALLARLLLGGDAAAAGVGAARARPSLAVRRQPDRPHRRQSRRISAVTSRV